mgnify:CR=1 FL=1
MSIRAADRSRKTTETEINVSVTVDGSGHYDVETGIGFFDHMLEQLARHSGMDLTIRAKGDLHIDDHHTVEDVGIALGMALNEALGERTGISRYGSAELPMDEALSRAAIDVSGRPFLVWKLAFNAAKIGSFDTELVREFFQAFAMNGRLTRHVEGVYGDNNHHIAESAFKAVARALRVAIALDSRESGKIPSTKGTL